MDGKDEFVPALRYNWLTGLYDPLFKLWMFITLGKNFFDILIEQADLAAEDCLLDFGCGTGLLTVKIKEAVPTASVYGVDIDSNALGYAAKNIKKKGHDIGLSLYDGHRLPYEEESFDKVLSSFVFHHLDRERKIGACQEIYRVLKVGGTMHIADFGGAKNTLMRNLFRFIQLLDGVAATEDNIKGYLPQIFAGVGFKDILEHRQIATLVGPVSFYSAFKGI